VKTRVAVLLGALLCATPLLAAAPGAAEASSTSTSAGTGTSAATATSTTVPRLHREGRWLVDGQGRVVVVHGVNLVYKPAPYAPPDTPSGFTAADADWLARYGFNAARLGVLWAGVDPTGPDAPDPAYLGSVDRVADLLAQRHIWTMFDAHQDQWSETYGGEGAPAWATQRPFPFGLFPVIGAPFPEGYWMPELSTLFDRFWANGGGLLDDYAAFWRQVAAHYVDQPYSMGYDLFNEPWAGLEWPTCLTLGCRPTYTHELQPAFEKMLAAIRQVDREAVVWFEPQQFFGGQKVRSYFTPVAGEDNLGFSWHNYCPAVFLASAGLPVTDMKSCVAYTENRQATALAQAGTMAAVPMMSEWGATDNTQALAIDATGADNHAMGWTYWAYKRWNDPTTADTAQGLFRDDADLSSVKQDKLAVLVRTYPQATAGTPGPFSYDSTTGEFRYTYTPDPAVTAPTRIFVSPLTTPDGYDVAVTGGHVTGRDGQYVDIAADGSAPVAVHISAR
jgi:endoglycosylceramidase